MKFGVEARVFFFPCKFALPSCPLHIVRRPQEAAVGERSAALPSPHMEQRQRSVGDRNSFDPR